MTTTNNFNILDSFGFVTIENTNTNKNTNNAEIANSNIL